MSTKVTTINAKGKHVSKLQTFALNLAAADLEDLATLGIVLFIVFCSDTTYLSAAEKGWLAMAAYLVKLFVQDLTAAPAHKVKLIKAHDSTKVINRGMIYVSKCTFTIPTVKILREDLEGPVSGPLARRVHMCLQVTADAERWDVWHSYEDFMTLQAELRLSYPSVSVPSLTSFAQIYEDFKRSPGQVGMTSFSLLRGRGDPSSSLTDRSLLTLLSLEVTSFLRAIAQHSPLNSSPLVLAVLGIPYTANRVHRRRPQHAGLTEDSKMQDNFQLFLQQEKDFPVTATTAVTVAEDDGFCKGSNLREFQFLDQSIEARAVYKDCRNTHDFKVRGPGYMTNKKKIEGGPALLKFLLFEFIEVNRAVYGDRHDHIARYGDPPISSCCYFAVPKAFFEDADTAKTAGMYKKFMDIPSKEKVGSESSKSDHSNTAGVTPSAPASCLWPPPDRHLSDALPSDDEEPSISTTKKKWGTDIVWPAEGEPGVLSKKSFQNQRFKLVPQMVEAPWVLQAAVSSTPCLLGQKIVQRYWKGPGYLEIDLHVGSSAIADNIVSLCRSYATAFVITLGVVLQGESEAELPEQVLATFQLHRADLNARTQLDA